MRAVGKSRRRAVLISVRVGPRPRGPAGKPPAPEAELAELSRLADTAGIEVVSYMVQPRSRLVPSTYVGAGFAERIRDLAVAEQVGLVISDDDLSPAQGRNLEKLTQCRVLDRTELILEIFTAHVRTLQARLQVELARNEYALPRLKRMWTHLERIRGGIGMRGPGEKQIEIDRRLLRRRIRDLRRELVGIASRKAREVARRAEVFTVAIVGYTNAGKSSLFNRLVDSRPVALVADRLFSTLDTRTRLWDLGGGRRALLSDTVGFIRKLPHHLVASFHATLEEVRMADLLLHVVDVSDEDPVLAARAVRDVLEGMGCDTDRELVILNKTDRLESASRTAEVEHFSRLLGSTVAVSAHTGDGIDALIETVGDVVERSWVEEELLVDPGDGRRLALIAAHGEILSREEAADDGKVKLRVRVDPRALGWLRGRRC